MLAGGVFAVSREKFLAGLAEVGALAGGGGVLGGVLGLIAGTLAGLIWPSAGIKVADWVGLGGALAALFVLLFLGFAKLGV
jgi:hypothetical protein